jgi:hypothetical protein
LTTKSPRSPTDLSPAQLVFGCNLTDSIPFSRQMLRPQNRYKIEKRQLEVRENQRHKNNSLKGRKLPLLRSGQRVRFQDPITKKWTLTGKVTGFGKTDRDYWVKDNDKAHRYRRNQHIIKPINVEAVRPPVQPVRAPPPFRREAGVDSRLFAKVASQPPKPSTASDPPRSGLSRPRTGERIRTKTVRFEAGEEKRKTGKVGQPRKEPKKTL